jgi:hypothetical protein
VLAVWQEPFEDLRAARVDVDRRLVLDVRLPAHRLLPAALVRAREADRGDRVCSARPLAEGRPPMGIVVRAAGRRAASTRCPTTPSAASRTSSSTAAEHARRAGERLAAAGGLGAALPRALGRRLPRDRLDVAAAVRRVPLVTAVASGVRLPRHLVPARPRADRAGAERARVLDVVRARRAATPTRCSSAAGLRARAACARVDPRARGAAPAPGEVEILTYQPSVRLTMTRAPAPAAWRGGRDVAAGGAVRAGAREGPLTGGGVELLAISKPIAGEASCG